MWLSVCVADSVNVVFALTGLIGAVRLGTCKTFAESFIRMKVVVVLIMDKASQLMPPDEGKLAGRA